jgi:hypothetical protein
MALIVTEVNNSHDWWFMACQIVGERQTLIMGTLTSDLIVPA